MSRYQELRVWQEAMDLVDQIYEQTSRFPGSEKFGLVAQLRRSAISVPSNISEGAGRRRPAEFIRFLDIAYGSLMEVQTQLEIARRRGFLSDSEALQTTGRSEDVARMLNGLRGYLL